MSERPVKITRLRFEHLVEPLGIGTPRPRLSWATETERQGWRQAAYQVEVERDAGPAVASVWVEDGDGKHHPGIFVGNNEASGWFGGGPSAYVVHPEAHQAEVVSMARIIPKN